MFAWNETSEGIATPLSDEVIPSPQIAAVGCLGFALIIAARTAHRSGPSAAHPGAKSVRPAYHGSVDVYHESGEDLSLTRKLFLSWRELFGQIIRNSVSRHQRRGVHAPLPPARAATWLPQSALLWLVAPLAPAARRPLPANAAASGNAHTRPVATPHRPTTISPDPQPTPPDEPRRWLHCQAPLILIRTLSPLRAVAP